MIRVNNNGYMYRKIRNTLRFMMGNLYDFDADKDRITEDKLMPIDRFMLSKASRTFGQIVGDYENFNFHKACQKIFNFCNLDLSSFYLDILKDRLYTYPPNSEQRKSAQNVIFYITKNLLKIIAPILPFTAEEAFGCFENWKGRERSVYLHDFAEDFGYSGINDILLTEGGKILILRSAVLKEIEKIREAAVVGSSLEVVVVITCQGKDYSFYSQRGELLREIFIVSDVIIEEGKFNIKVKKADSNKCSRCWNFRKDVGKSMDYPEVCLRCAEALKIGEFPTAVIDINEKEETDGKKEINQG